VAGALLLLLLLVLLAFGVQQYKNYRMRQAELKLPDLPPAAQPEQKDLEQFLPPQQLPMTELPIPE